MFFEIVFIQLNMYSYTYTPNNIIAYYHKNQMQMSSTFYTSHLTARTMTSTQTAISSFYYYHEVGHELNYVAT